MFRGGSRTSPRRGLQSLGGRLPNILAIFSEKPYEIKEILVRRGARAGCAPPPPKSATGLFIVTKLFNIAVNDIDVKESPRCNRTRCRRYPVYTEVLRLQDFFTLGPVSNEFGNNEWQRVDFCSTKSFAVNFLKCSETTSTTCSLQFLQNVFTLWESYNGNDYRSV